METLQATSIVQGVFSSLKITPATKDSKFDCAIAVISLFNQAKKKAHVAIYSLAETKYCQCDDCGE